MPLAATEVLPETARPRLLTPPYAHSQEHLADELARIDQLIRAQTVRWRLTVAAAKPEHLWGMVHVTDQEVETYLRAPFRPPGELHPELEAALRPYRLEAEAIAETIAGRLERTSPEVPLRLVRLSELFGLSGRHRDVLLLCLLPELDGRYRRLFGYLRDDASRTRPSVELILEILHPVIPDAGTARAVFDPAGPLLAHRLVALEDDSEPLSMRSPRIDERIAGFLLGRDEIDSRLRQVLDGSPPGFGEAVAWEELVISDEERERLDSLAAAWAGRRGPEAGLTLFLHGPYGSGRLLAARALTTASGTPLLVARAQRAVESAEGWERIVDLAFREAGLRGAAIIWRGCEKLVAEEERSGRWQRLVTAAEGFGGLTFLASEVPWEPAGGFRRAGSFLRLDFAVPNHSRRRRLWGKHLPPAASFAGPAPDRPRLLEALANGFQFTGGQIAAAVISAWSAAARRDPERPLLEVDDVYEGCRRQSSRRLTAFGRRIEPRTELTFDDLIVPAANRRHLEELRGRIRDRGLVVNDLGFDRRLLLGKGLVALFTGSSGTGKTMAAALLAREQGVDLYKVDLSAVVSKYVGETEKNLARVFAEAEDANAILFFDEADALFGKRGEVKDARDRWANMEINFLLQRVEEYAGVVILASNLRQNIDEAFLRRIQMIVDFPFPDAAHRLRIWRVMFPAGLGRPDDGELGKLAERFRLAGGSIKNIVLDGAFRALAANMVPAPGITLEHLVLGTAREYQKLGKPITRRDFGEEYHRWVAERILGESGEG